MKDLAVKICYQMNFKNGISERSDSQVANVRCIWPKSFIQRNYCFRSAVPNSLTDFPENSHNCSENEILAKFKQEETKPQTQSKISGNDGKEAQKVSAGKIVEKSGHPLENLIKELGLNETFPRNDNNSNQFHTITLNRRRKVSWKLVMVLTTLIVILSTYSIAVYFCTPQAYPRNG